MVFHAFKGDDEVDTILRSIPFGARSKFIKDKIKAGVLVEKEETPKKDVPEQKVYIIRRKKE